MNELMKRILRYSIYSIFAMLLVIALYLAPKIQFLSQLYNCASNMECVLRKGD